MSVQNTPFAGELGEVYEKFFERDSSEGRGQAFPGSGLVCRRIYSSLSFVDALVCSTSIVFAALC